MTHHAVRDRLLCEFIVTYDSDLDEDSWRGISEMLKVAATPLTEKLDFLQALFPALEGRFDGEHKAMECFVAELVTITQQESMSAIQEEQNAKYPFSHSSSSTPSLSTEEEGKVNLKQITYAACLEIFKKHEISDSEIDEETLEYLVDVLGNEVDQADRSDQLELLQLYLPTAEMDNREELLDDMIMLSKETIRLREQVTPSVTTAIASSTSCAFFNIKEQEVKEDEDSDSTKQKQAWMASQDNKECKKSILQLYNKEFITGPGDIVEKKVGVNSSSSGKPKKHSNSSLRELSNPTVGDSSQKIRYRDGEIVAYKGEKFITEANPSDDYDGGSRGKVKLKGKRGVGWVNG